MPESTSIFRPRRLSFYGRRLPRRLSFTTRPVFLLLQPAVPSFEAVTGVPAFIGLSFVFVSGCLIGRFLNVVIYRLPCGRSVVYPNSAGPGCGAAIKPYDNIPILSWLMLGGKCRSCKSSISFRYPAVELLTGLLFLVVAWELGFSAFLPVALL